MVAISITGTFIFCPIFFVTYLKISVSFGFFMCRKSSKANLTLADTPKSVEVIYFNVFIFKSGSRNSLFLKNDSLLEPSD